MSSTRLTPAVRRRRRALPWLAAIVAAAAALVATATPASAASAPPGYMFVTSWSGSGSTYSSPLPSPYVGTVTYTAGPGQTTNSPVNYAVRSYPDKRDYATCLNGKPAPPNMYNETC